jgi:hypothetical protein
MGTTTARETAPFVEQPSLFLPLAARARLRRTLAQNDWLHQIYKAVEARAEEDATTIERQPVGLLGDQIPSPHRLQWYQELQEAHFAADEIARLALCYAISGRLTFATKGAARLQKALSRPELGDSPMQDLVVASLARSLCLSLDLLQESRVLDKPAALRDQIRERLVTSAKWLEYYLIKGGNVARRNHDVIVACTLGLIGLTCRGEPAALKWLKLALERLESLLLQDDRYLGEDGDWYEGSLRYQLYILSWLALFADACRNIGLRNYYGEPKIRLLFTSLSHFVTCQGMNLGFNDTSHDEASILGLWPLLKGAVEYQDGFLLSRLQLLLQAVPAPASLPAEAFLALGWNSLPRPAENSEVSVHFRRSGLVISRYNRVQGESLFAIDCGPHSSHHHLAKGAIEYYYGGSPILLDAGCGHYLDRALWIRPEMHNVVVVNGGYVPHYAHPLYGDQGWDFIPDWHGRLLDVRSNRHLTYVQADYAASAGVPTAVRSCWYVSPGYLIIEDLLAADELATHEYSAFFHAAGEVRLADGERIAYLTVPNGQKAALYVLAPDEASLATGFHPLATGSMPLVKSGGAYRGIKLPVSELHYLKVQATGNRMRFLSVIVPDGMQYSRLSDAGDARALKVEHADGSQDLWIFQATASPIRRGSVETDGRVAFVRQAAGHHCAWFIQEGCRLTSDGELLVDSPLATTFLGAAQESE